MKVKMIMAVPPCRCKCPCKGNQTGQHDNQQNAELNKNIKELLAAQQPKGASLLAAKGRGSTYSTAQCGVAEQPLYGNNGCLCCEYYPEMDATNYAPKVQGQSLVDQKKKQKSDVLKWVAKISDAAAIMRKHVRVVVANFRCTRDEW